ncbi:MAG: 3-hydroxy-3-methylglutaryl-CoA lyase [Deltaproteobacteria bacterium]|nr:3-hydroxy-3-methylglutaryl-CoA lyase [Deltaproteobacteria bacterium]
MEQWITDDYYGSEYNFLKEIRDTFDLPKSVRFHDATLRDGEQTPGVVFTKEKKVEIAKLLDELGVDRIEAGMPTVSDEDFEAIKEIVALKLKAEIMLFSRAMEVDIDKAVEAKVDGLILEVPSGYPRVVNQFPQWSFDDVIKNSVKAVKYAKSKGLYITFFPYDTTRAKPDFLEALYTAVVKEAKADAVAVIDTIGCALPQSIYYMVKKVRSWVNVPVEIHTHNDFGMGIATTLAAVQAGAQVVHGCVTGLGERTGNSALEQIAMGLRCLMGMDINLDLTKLYPVCKRVSELSNVPIPINAPVTGDVAFAREIGLGAKLFKTSPTTIFPVNPAMLGRTPRIVLGKKSGKDSIKIKLDEYNLSYDDALVAKLVNEVKLAGIRKGTYLTDEEFLKIYHG